MTIEIKPTNETTTTLGRVIASGEDAFIGSVGNGPEDLYIVSYTSVILAREPKQSWSNFSTDVYIKEFVDLEITIKRR